MKKVWLISFVVIIVSANWHCRRSSQDMKFVENTSAAPLGDKPNIIFLLADDMRYDAMGYTGNKIAITPNLDSLAAQGTNFKNTYVTTSICAISRASIFTGEYASRHGIDNFTKDLSSQELQNSYPLLLRRNGYYTGFIGKYGVGNNPPENSFDYWKGFTGQGVYFYTDANGNKVHSTVLMGEEAIDFFKNRDKAKPFCLSISFKAPHSEDNATTDNGFITDPYFDSWYSNIDFPYPETYKMYNYQFSPQWRMSPQKHENEARVRWGMRFSPEKFQTSYRSIYRLNSGIDRVVGELRNYLKSTGLDKNTIIVFSSDNGYYMGEHGLEGKWYGHEESIRVPLIIYDPRMPQQQKIVDQIVLNIDLAPTILTWADIDVPGQMQGKPLQPLLSGSATSWRKEFFYEHPYDGGDSYIPKTVGIVTPTWKYMRYYNGNNSTKDVVHEELFDVSADPHEKKNRIHEPGQQSRIDEFKRKVMRYEQVLK